MRFHLDEHIDPAIAEGLKQRGIDVSTCQSSGLLSASDSEHIAFALAEDRVIFTNDTDFLVAASERAKHAGIVYCAPQNYSVGQAIRFLCLMHDCLGQGEMHGRIEFL